MSTKKILERIKVLEEEKAKLMPLRKEEIFHVLNNSGGITLDNKLLAGLAIFASNPANKNSNFLRELAELGKTKIPSKSSRAIDKKANSKASIQQDANKKVQAHG